MTDDRHRHRPPDPDPELPVDSDLDVEDAPDGTPRPVHLRLRYLLLVAAGGTVGTGAREGLTLAFPADPAFDTVIFAINIVGALLLGVLLESLARAGSDEGRRRTARLLLGTGALGGFTTYSTLATDTAHLLTTGHPAPAALYALGTVLLGALASWTGIALAAALHPRRTQRKVPA